MSTQDIQQRQRLEKEGIEIKHSPQSSHDGEPVSSTNSADPEGLLEPSFELDSSIIEKNLHKSDQAFAKEVVRLIADRAERGIFARDCWGYKFLDPPVHALPAPAPFSYR
jgi:hypothetical protein